MGSSAPADPLIRIRGLRYRYPGSDQDVLRIPSLDVSGRGLIALTGPSGVGKTTLVELLAGTLQEDYEGSVEVLGKQWKSLTRDADRQRQLRRVGLIPQDYGLLPRFTPHQTIEQDLADAGVPTKERVDRIATSLAQVDMQPFAHRQIAGLSGGQRQRAAIARMLARDVDLVIADEPTANLDPELVNETLALLRQLADRVPVLVVTHDPRVAEVCDRTIVLQSAMPALEGGTAASSHTPPRSPRFRWAKAVAVVALILGLGGVASALILGNRSERSLRSSTPAPSLVPQTPTSLSTSPPAPSPSRTTLAASAARASMAETIATYHKAINAGDYYLAWLQLTPAERQKESVDHLATDDATSFGFNIRIHSVAFVGPSEAIVYTTFTSTQAAAYGPNGRDTCDHWTLDYVMKLVGSKWLIDQALPHNGSTHTTC